ncbi:MAG: mobilization protein MobD [Neptuniibacter sp.]
MSIIHFVGGEKGGVGKSVLSRLLSQYFLDNSMAFSGMDADQSHATLTRYYSDFTSAINMDEFESIDNVMEVALEEERQVLIDLPAQSERFLDKWIEENGVLDLCQEMDVKLVYWYTVDGGPDSVDLLAKFLDKYNDLIHCVVVKNHGCGNDFSGIESLPQLESAEASRFAEQIVLPALHTPTMEKIDKLGLSFWAAANLKESGVKHLSLMERQRSKVWVKKGYAAVNSAMVKLAAI